jgi:hypothetical protein
MSALDVAGVAGAILGFIFLAFFVLAAMIFIVGVSNRSDADPKGSRPMAAYLFSGSFLFLWIAYGGLVVALDSLVNLIGTHSSEFGSFGGVGLGIYGQPSYDNEAIRDCVIGAILLVFVGGAYLLHLRRGNLLADAEDNPSGPTKRVMRSYVAFVSFIAVIIFVLAISVAVYGVFELISPSIFGGGGSRDATTRGILDALVLVVLSGGVFSFHQRFAPAALRLLGRTTSTPAPHADAPPTPPVPPTPV